MGAHHDGSGLVRNTTELKSTFELMFSQNAPVFSHTLTLDQKCMEVIHREIFVYILQKPLKTVFVKISNF